MEYFGLIFTLHAQNRMKNRGVKIAEAWNAFKNPTRTIQGKYGGSEFQRELDDYKITVVAAQNKKNKWVVKSVWRDPPLPGTTDAMRKESWRKYEKSGFLGKILLTIKQQIGF